jgi:hypothetical protein
MLATAGNKMQVIFQDDVSMESEIGIFLQPYKAIEK